MLQAITRFMVVLLLPAASLAAAGAVPLVEAVREGNASAMRALLQQRVDVNAAEPDGTTSLHWAARRNDLTAVDLLMRAGARATAVNAFGITPLSLAAEYGSRAVVDRLLKAGADANTRVKGGETVLMTAAHAGNADAVLALIEAGADVNAKETTRGQTALMWAAAEGHADVVRHLVRHGADIKAVSHAPASPKNITDGASLYSRNAPRVDVFAPLQFAVRAGRIEAAKALLEAKADTAVTTPQGMDLLTLAIANAHFDMAAFLIEHGSNVNAATGGWTPLHYIVRMRSLEIGGFPQPQPTGSHTTMEITKTLLARGADVDARTTKGFQDGYRVGISTGSTPFLLAAKGADVPMMRFLVANGADVTARNSGGSNAIGLAAGMEMSSPNQDSGMDEDAFQALKLALQLGAGDIDAVNRSGETALHNAVFRGTTKGLRLLAEHGAKLDIKSKRGKIPIEDALFGIPGGSVVKSTARPDSAKVLHEFMVAQGLPSPGYELDKSRYNFDVKVEK